MTDAHAVSTICNVGLIMRRQLIPTRALILTGGIGQVAARVIDNLGGNIEKEKGKSRKD